MNELSAAPSVDVTVSCSAWFDDCPHAAAIAAGAAQAALRDSGGSGRFLVDVTLVDDAGSLAFAGAYSASLMGCIEFTGWADTDVNLDYDAARRALVARFHVRDIHLNNTPAILNGPLLGMVQGTIDRRYNPVELFTLEKLSTRVDIQPAGGALQLRAKEVRAEISPSAVTLHIIYEFVKG